jgi:hypothetical protein
MDTFSASEARGHRLSAYTCYRFHTEPSESPAEVQRWDVGTEDLIFILLLFSDHDTSSTERRCIRSAIQTFPMGGGGSYIYHPTDCGTLCLDVLGSSAWSIGQSIPHVDLSLPGDRREEREHQQHGHPDPPRNDKPNSDRLDVASHGS